VTADGYITTHTSPQPTKTTSMSVSKCWKRS